MVASNLYWYFHISQNHRSICGEVMYEIHTSLFNVSFIMTYEKYPRIISYGTFLTFLSMVNLVQYLNCFHLLSTLTQQKLNDAIFPRQ